MEILNWLGSSAHALPDMVIWGMAATFALLESGIGLGIFIPGETIVILLAATSDDPFEALLLSVAVMLGASAGDHIGFGIGRYFGPRLRDTRLFRRFGTATWDRAVDVLERRGAAAVFWTRLIPVVRTLTPAAAGVAKLRYRAFLPASLAGAAMWSALLVGLGFLVRGSLEAMQGYLGAFGGVLGGVVGVVAVFLLIRMKLMKRKRAMGSDPGIAVEPAPRST